MRCKRQRRVIPIREVWPEEEIQSLKAVGAKEVICPICKNETLDNWTICPHCMWEYDGSRGYSPANGCRKWWYRLRYRLGL